MKYSDDLKAKMYDLVSKWKLRKRIELKELVKVYCVYTNTPIPADNPTLGQQRQMLLKLESGLQEIYDSEKVAIVEITEVTEDLQQVVDSIDNLNTDIQNDKETKASKGIKDQPGDARDVKKGKRVSKKGK